MPVNRRNFMVGMLEISFPFKIIVPVVSMFSYNSCIRLIARSKVLLPQPDGPIIAVTLFRFISAETFFTAYFPLSYDTERFCMESTGSFIFIVFSVIFYFDLAAICFDTIFKVKTIIIKSNDELHIKSIILGSL